MKRRTFLKLMGLTTISTLNGKSLVKQVRKKVAYQSEVSSGDYLTNIAMFKGVVRRHSESDASLRQRVLSSYRY